MGAPFLLGAAAPRPTALFWGAQVGGKDGRWTTGKAFTLMAGAGFPGTVEEARTHLANKHRRQ